MITTVCMNPSLDHTLAVNGLEKGGLNRAVHSRVDPAGKGINVALALRALGRDVFCTGPLYEDSLELFHALLSRHGVHEDFHLMSGSTRVNMKLRDVRQGSVTEINEPGMPLSEADLQAVTEKFVSLASCSELAVLSGSTPPGCPDEYYRDLILRIQKSGSRCILDADGEKLRLGLEGSPYLVKPNRAELEGLFGRRLNSLLDVEQAAKSLIARYGVRIVVVSLGGEGAVAVNEQRAVYAPALGQVTGSTVGAGDAMVAGLTAGVEMNFDLPELFALGVACAFAACQTEGTQVFSADGLREALAKVKLTAL